MSDDSFDTPLAKNISAPKKGLPPHFWSIAFTCLVFGAIGISLLTSHIFGNPDGGAPIAGSTIVEKKPEIAPVKPPVQAPKAPTISIIDGTTGKVREVEIGGGAAKVIDLTSLTDKGKYGDLPKIQSDGTKPYELNASNFKPASVKEASLPRAALIIGGVGLNAELTEKALSGLAKEITLALASPAPNIEEIAAKARLKGVELLLQIPMEHSRSKDTVETPFTLKTTLPSLENIDRLHKSLARSSAILGVINYSGDKFLKTDTAYAPILKELAMRGLLVVDDGSNQTLTLDLAKKASAAAIQIDVHFDPNKIDASFMELEKQAKEKGVAVGYSLLYPQLVEKANSFVKSSVSRGVLFTPLSATLGRKGI